MYERHAEKYSIMHIHANLLIKLGFNSKSVWVFKPQGGSFRFVRVRKCSSKLFQFFILRFYKRYSNYICTLIFLSYYI